MFVCNWEVVKHFAIVLFRVSVKGTLKAGNSHVSIVCCLFIRLNAAADDRNDILWNLQQKH